ncbi:MAG: SDR family oxidoreductase [Pseudomonadota bacterium]
MTDSRVLRSLLVLAAVVFTCGTEISFAHDHTASKTVVITGANRGIGLEFARQYASDGWTVIGTARSPDRADDLKGLDVEILQLDVTVPASVDAFAAALEGRSVDLLINNAGFLARGGGIDDVEIDNYTQMLMVNSVGPVRVTQALMPQLREGQRKKVINITSQLASIAQNESGGYYGYRESKTALNMFTRTLAAELGPEGFICVAVHPGWVQTDMGGAGATLTPEESVSSMRAVIDGLTADDNGEYRSYTGETVAW